MRRTGHILSHTLFSLYLLLKCHENKDNSLKQNPFLPQNANHPSNVQHWVSLAQFSNWAARVVIPRASTHRALPAAPRKGPRHSQPFSLRPRFPEEPTAVSFKAQVLILQWIFILKIIKLPGAEGQTFVVIDLQRVLYHLLVIQKTERPPRSIQTLVTLYQETCRLPQYI